MGTACARTESARWTVRLATARLAAARLAGRWRDERGVALVEFAIVLPVLIMLVLGVFDLGLYVSYSDDEQHIAEEAVRFAAVDSNPGGSTTLQTYMWNQASGGLRGAAGSSQHVYIYLSPSTATNTTGNAVRACVTATVPAIPFLGIGSTTITQTATMRLEQAETSSVYSFDTPPSACPTS